ncbi:uncharacterized protein RAG0_15160 [Rhynchosporium agropyri]|uniref:Uncharacterized protein n=1 Tax=Rhynchosporium agropyri TaxID=914238 RepID=A0A1E1LJW2_9HELO|nr:uncharacterized protein RAG0_15160 [Rhynchosporium agropyri]
MKELTDYLRILLEESTLYTLEQDRRAEYSIRTIIEKPEILLACIYIANLTSTSRVEGKTPFECFWDDIKLKVNYTPSIKYLRILGYPIFILINKEKRVQSYKVAPRAEKGILVGFESHNIYRYLVNRKVL